MTNQEFWNNLGDYLVYPNESVVRFLSLNKPKNGAKKVFLDWGCASGRHLAVARDFGYELIGVDYAPKMLEKARQNIKDVKLILNQGLDIKEIENESIDVLLCFGVIFYNTKEDQQAMLNNIFRMLKKGGAAFLDFRSNRDTGHKAEHLKGTHLITQSLAEVKSAITEAGLSIENIELFEISRENMSLLNSWYQIVAKKL